MSHYILSIGSNTPDKAGKMAEALQWLDREFGQITVSGIYATKAWSGNAPDYLNMVACVQSSLSAEEMNLKAKEFERSLGRTPQSKNNGSVPMDVDVVISDGTILRPEEYSRPYITHGLSLIKQM